MVATYRDVRHSPVYTAQIAEIEPDTRRTDIVEESFTPKLPVVQSSSP